MKKWIYVSFMSVALIGAAALSHLYAADPAPGGMDKGSSAPGAPDQGGGMQSPGASDQAQKLSGVEVTNVDKAKGTIQIKKKEGGQETLKLDESAKAEIDKIQKGDKVDVDVVSRNGEKFAKSVTKAG